MSEAKRFGAIGGKKRAATLSKEELKAIGIAGAEARWGKIPVAQHSGVLKIGDLEIPCSVLEDGKRVLSETGFTKALGRARSGSAWLPGANPGARMPHFAPPKRLMSFLGEDLAKELQHPIKYRSTIGGKVGYGVDATLIPAICEAWLQARDSGVLNAQQMRTADKAEILVRGLARVGIIAMVDEATGFQDFRAQDALAKFLERYVAKELRQWVRTFPLSFFRQLCRLKGMPFPADMRLPRYFGIMVNDLVYDRLAPQLRGKLEERNPKTETGGRRKNKHFQWLTEEVGNPRLLHHLGLLEGLAAGFADGDYDAFRAKVVRMFPNHGPLFNQTAELPRLPAASSVAVGALAASSSASASPDGETSPAL